MAAGADLGCIVELALLGADELAGQRGGELLIFHDLGRVAEPDRYAAALGDSRSCLAVGLVDQVVVGYALAGLADETGHDICMIEELFVHANARGVGVGARLLAQVRWWGVKAGCKVLESHVLPGNRAAKNFFERVGMVTRKMRVSAEL